MNVASTNLRLGPPKRDMKAFAYDPNRCPDCGSQRVHFSISPRFVNQEHEDALLRCLFCGHRSEYRRTPPSGDITLKLYERSLGIARFMHLSKPLRSETEIREWLSNTEDDPDPRVGYFILHDSDGVSHAIWYRGEPRNPAAPLNSAEQDPTPVI